MCSLFKSFVSDHEFIISKFTVEYCDLVFVFLTLDGKMNSFSAIRNNKLLPERIEDGGNYVLSTGPLVFDWGSGFHMVTLK